MELIVFAFSLDLSAENSNLSAVSGNQRNQLFGCMTRKNIQVTNKYGKDAREEFGAAPQGGLLILG